VRLVESVTGTELGLGSGGLAVLTPGLFWVRIGEWGWLSLESGGRVRARLFDRDQLVACDWVARLGSASGGGAG
jgi:hypothetical protein